MSEETEQKENKLTGKQKKFADCYLGEANLNGTRAAKMAKYEGNDNVLAVTASRLLRNAKVSTYIDAQLKDCGMSANEVITRLTEIARGDANDLLDEKGFFSINVARERGKTYLIKKLKTKRTLKQKKTEISDNMQTFLAEDETEAIETDVEIIYEETEFEIADSHAALRDIGKIHKLFTDKTEFSGEVGVKHSIDEQTIKDINAAYDGTGE